MRVPGPYEGKLLTTVSRAALFYKWPANYHDDFLLPGDVVMCVEDLDETCLIRVLTRNGLCWARTWELVPL